MQIKKKVYTALAVCATLCSAGFVASAQITDVSYDMSYGVITLSGNTDASNKRISYKAFKNDANEILGIGESEAKEDGSFEIKVGFKDSGDYMIKIKDGSGAIIQHEISEYICLADSQDTLLAKINTGSDAEIKLALDEINFIFETTEWTKMTDTNLTSWLMKYIKEHRVYGDIEALESEYANLNALYLINKAKVADIVSKVSTYAQILGISEDSQVKAFMAGATVAQKSALVSELANSPATTPQALKAAIQVANNAKTPSGGGSSSGGSSSAGNGIIIVDKNNESKTETEIIPSVKTEKFTDLVNASWAKEAVEALADKGVISGYDDGTFRPNANVTREEFVKMVVVAFDIPYEGKNCSFLDVFENDWFRPYVGAAQECGIVTGIADDIFGIRKEITRQEAVVILKRAADYAGITFEPIREYKQFSDQDNISDFAREAVEVLYQSGTVNGRADGGFAPLATCTRAETAKMIYGII